MQVLKNLQKIFWFADKKNKSDLHYGMTHQHVHTYSMETRLPMKSLRKCFNNLSNIVSRQTGRLTHELWFEYAAISSPSDKGKICTFLLSYNIAIIQPYLLMKCMCVMLIQYRTVEYFSSGTWRCVLPILKIENGVRFYQTLYLVMVFCRMFQS